MSYVPTKQVFSFAEEFKSFLFKGNMIDMAVGIIIGGAFGKLVESLVKNIIMPGVMMITTGGTPSPAPAPTPTAQAAPAPAPSATTPAAAPEQAGDFLRKGDAPTIRGVKFPWRDFVADLVNFLILGAVIFIVIVKFVGFLNKKKKDDVVAPPPPPPDVALLTEIRDLLKAQAKPQGS